MTIKRINGIVQFFQGTQEKWTGLQSIVRNNVLVYSIDDRILKIGDGASYYENLPVLVDVNDILDKYLSVSVPAMFDIPNLPADFDKIVIVGEEARIVYGELTASELQNTISNITASTVDQQTKIDAYNTRLIQLLSSITIDDEDKLVIVNSNLYNPSIYKVNDYILESVRDSVSSVSLSITSLEFFTEIGCVNRVYSMLDNATYYAKIDAVDANENPIGYTLSCTDPLVDCSSEVDTGIFQVVISDHLNGNVNSAFNAVAYTDFTSRQLVVTMKIIDKEGGIKNEDVVLKYYFDEAMTREATNNLVSTGTFYALVTAIDSNGFDILSYNLVHSNMDVIPGVVITQYGSLNNTFTIELPNVPQGTTINFLASAETQYKEVFKAFSKNITDAATGLIVRSVKFYNTIECNTPEILVIGDNKVSYAKVDAEDNNGFLVTYSSLVSNDNDVNIHITHTLGDSSPIFEITVDDVEVDIESVVFTATISNGYVEKTVTSSPTLVYDGMSGLNMICFKLYKDSGCTVGVDSSAISTDLDNPPTAITITPTGTYPGNLAFFGGVKLLDGRVFCIPCNSATARIYDPDTDTLSIPTGVYPIGGAFSGGVLLNDGRVFCVPTYSTTARIYDPDEDTVSIPTGTYPGDGAFVGGVLLNDGRVFCVPSNSTTARIYDPDTDTLSIPSGTYPGLNAFHGGVLLDDGRVFCVPCNSTTARIYDPVTNTLSIPIGTYPGGDAFVGGVTMSDGKIFCIPFGSISARIYDPDTDTLSIPTGVYPGGGAFHGGALLPDGKVFCVPCNSTTARVYDPVTNTLSIPAGSYPGSGAFVGAITLDDGRIFCVPHYSTTARIYGHRFDHIYYLNEQTTYYGKVIAHDIHDLPITYSIEDEFNFVESVYESDANGVDGEFRITIGSLNAEKVTSLKAYVENEYVQLYLSLDDVTLVDSSGKLSLSSIKFYSDISCDPTKEVVDKIFDTVTYYAKVFATNIGGDKPIVYESLLPSSSVLAPGTFISKNIGQYDDVPNYLSPIFEISINNRSGDLENVVFTATVSNGYTPKKTITKTMNVLDASMGFNFENIKLYNNVLCRIGDEVTQFDNSGTYYAVLNVLPSINGGSVDSHELQMQYTLDCSDIENFHIVSDGISFGNPKFTISVYYPTLGVDGVDVTFTGSASNGIFTDTPITKTVHINDTFLNISITETKFYTTDACVPGTDVKLFFDLSSYYLKVAAIHANGDPLIYNLPTTTSALVTAITRVGSSNNNVFKIDIGDVTTANEVVEFICSVESGIDVSEKTLPITFIDAIAGLSVEDEIVFYKEITLENKVVEYLDIPRLFETYTFYAKVSATDVNNLPITYKLNCDEGVGVIKITPAGFGAVGIQVFTVEVLGHPANIDVEFTVTVDNGYGTKTSANAKAVKVHNGDTIFKSDAKPVSIFKNSDLNDPADGVVGESFRLLDETEYWVRFGITSIIPFNLFEENKGTLVINSSIPTEITPIENDTNNSFKIKTPNFTDGNEIGITISGTYENEYGSINIVGRETITMIDKSSEFTFTDLAFYTDSDCLIPLVGLKLYKGKTYYGLTNVEDANDNEITVKSAITNKSESLMITPVEADVKKFEIKVKDTITTAIINASITITFNNTIKDISYTKTGINLYNGVTEITLPVISFFTDAGLTVPLSPVEFESIGTYYAKVTATESNSETLTYTLTEENTKVTTTAHLSNAKTNEWKIVLASDAVGSVVFTMTAISQYGSKSNSNTVSILDTNKLTVTGIGIFEYSNFTGQLDVPPKLMDDTTYYVKVFASNSAAPVGNVINYSLAKTAGTAGITAITQDSTIKEKFTFKTLPRSNEGSLTLTASCTDDFTGTTPVTRELENIPVYNYIAKLYTINLTGVDVLNSVAVDSQGNYIAVGVSGNSAIIIKLDRDMRLLSKKILSGSSSTYVFSDVAIDASNNIYAVGHYYSGSFNRALIVKLNSSLTPSMMKISTSTTDEKFNSVACSGSDVIAVGYRKMSFSGITKSLGLIVKFNSSLVISSSKYFQSMLNPAVDTSTFNTDISSVTVNSGGSIFITINRIKPVDSDLILLKLPSALNNTISNGRRYTMHATLNKRIAAKGISVDSSDNVTVVGEVNYNASTSNIYGFAIRTNSSFAFAGGGAFSPTPISNVYFTNIHKSSYTNRCIVSGYYNNKAIVVMIDTSLLTIVREKQIKGAVNYGYCIIEDVDKNFVLVGKCSDNPILIKLTENSIEASSSVSGTEISLTIEDLALTKGIIDTNAGLDHDAFVLDTYNLLFDTSVKSVFALTNVTDTAVYLSGDSVDDTIY